MPQIKKDEKIDRMKTMAQNFGGSKMEHATIIERLSHHLSTVKNITDGMSDGQAGWKPSREEWSVLEIINHMVDEEKMDFRTRLRLALEDPAATWPPIDPERWAEERDYNQRNFKQSCSNFFEERKFSVSWLKKLNSVDWKSTGRHPKLGPMSAEWVLANWLAHDLLHIRQIVGLQWAYLAYTVAPVSLNYAGSL
jgi:hypothetical protein